jgi:hypothetical protein
MPEKDPLTYQALTYVWILILSCTGGAVNFLRKVKLGTARPFNLPEFLGEILTSGFAGVITFYLCEWAGMQQLLSAVLVGVSGHMGSKALMLLEHWAEARFNKL